MAKKIYAADSDKEVRKLIHDYLARDGYEIRCFETGADLLSACEESVPDLVVIDTAVAGTDGFSCCAVLRSSYPELAIILTSASGNPYDCITALSLGSDDYLFKPYLPLELVMRIRAVLRRYELTPSARAPQDLKFGPLVLYPAQRMAVMNDQPVSLAPTEFDFLAYLIRQQGYSASREDLLKNLWKVDWQTDTRAVDHLVKRLRKKLHDLHSPIQIETVWGYGFRLSLADETI